MSDFLIGGDLPVRRIGFGAMHLSGDPRDTAITVARRAVELGVNLIDTAYLYGGGANEELLAEALHPYPQDLVLTTKVGVARTGPQGEWKIDGRPAVLREQVDGALRRLRTDRIELLQLHRIDPETLLADQVGTLAELRAAGKIGRIGLSEISVTELDQARSIVDIASVQNRYNVLDREHEPVLDACARAGIAFLPWRPVAAGSAGAPGSPDVAGRVAAVAAELDATATQVALAWLLGHSPVILPIPGTTRVAHLEENVAAGRIRLSDEQQARLSS
ncbi:aldo/keto reductase [Actinoplanes sp. DH11]|uniref:aldo/keto reductase n=1 Tax=Actinoplanes sp. DH11 TaxID=2857011 RepID=UPI001E46DC54|nr:aldo/keto reductase [Actinoplanes sp. DH11]